MVRFELGYSPCELGVFTTGDKGIVYSGFGRRGINSNMFKVLVFVFCSKKLKTL
jgi:hypothetical protein